MTGRLSRRAHAEYALRLSDKKPRTTIDGQQPGRGRKRQDVAPSSHSDESFSRICERLRKRPARNDKRAATAGRAPQPRCTSRCICSEFHRYQQYSVLATLAFVICLAVYREVAAVSATFARRPRDFLQRSIAAWAVVVSCLAIIGFALQHGGEFSRRVLLTWAVVTPVLIAAFSTGATSFSSTTWLAPAEPWSRASAT